jgi:hypothetical protein
MAAALARWLLGPGIAATPAANVAHALGDGLAGATAAASPSVALVGSRELLVISIRSAADLSNQRSARETQDLRHDRMSLPSRRTRPSLAGAGSL